MLTSPTSASPLAVHGRKTASLGLFYVNGSIVATAAATRLSASLGGYVIGARLLPSTPTSPYLKGEIMEIVYADANADRQRIEGYLAHKWGLAASLPADHPYKTAAPTLSVSPMSRQTLLLNTYNFCCNAVQPFCK